MMFRFTELRFGIGTWLIALAILTSLPMFLFSAYTIYQLGRLQQETILNQLSQRTDATANLVAQQLGVALGSLNTLAASKEAVNGDLPKLYQNAKRITRLNHIGSAISLIAPDGKMLFLTMRPFGETGQVAGDPAAARTVFETGQPTVSGPLHSPINDKIVTAVGVPVFRNGTVVYCIRMIIPTSDLNSLIKQQNLPADWISRIVDNHGFVLARSHEPELNVGKIAPPSLLQALAKNHEGVFDTITVEGDDVKTAIANVPDWHWKIAISVPKKSLNAPLQQAITMLVAFGVALAILGASASFWLARYISRNVNKASVAAAALHRGELLETESIPIRELDDMVASLDEVKRREHRNNEALLNITALHEKTSNDLEMARRDTLTGLPGRSLFAEMANALKQASDSYGGDTLAILFIDLDGFKAVNDIHGHAAGDRVLLQTAEILRGIVRETDVAGRLGGDEFVVCLTGSASQIEWIAQNVAERIVMQVAAIGNGIGCSLGIAVWTKACPNLEMVMRRADTAMYEAKRRGKNRFVTFGTGDKHDGTTWETDT